MLKAVIAILGIVSSSAFAQDSTVYFFDEEGQSTVELEDASYYRIVKPKGSLTHIRHYYASNDQLMFEGTYSRLGSSMELEGPYRSFYKDGKPASEGSYVKDRKVGLWKTYYPNGQQLDERFHDSKKIIYHQRWDESGKPMLTNGTGIFTLGTQTSEVIDSVLFAEFSVDSLSSDTLYIVVEEDAKYEGGMDAFFAEVAKELKYPKLARQYRVEGKVFVQFVIDNSGKLHGAEVVEGIGGGCDEIALEAVRNRTKWKPGKVRGRAVNQTMVLPVAFRLTGK